MGRRQAEARRQEWGKLRKTEKGTEKVSDREVSQHRSETPLTLLTAHPHEHLLKLVDAFLFQTEPQELQYKQRPWLALKKDFQGTGLRGHSGLCGGWGEGTEVCLTVQVALTDPGCILSMDKLVAAAPHKLRGSHVHMVANSGGDRRKKVGERS